MCVSAETLFALEWLALLFGCAPVPGVVPWVGPVRGLVAPLVLWAFGASGFRLFVCLGLFGAGSFVCLGCLFVVSWVWSGLQ